MGFLLRRGIKDANKRYTIYIALDIILIITFIWFGLTIKGEWQNGYQFCEDQACAICFHLTTNNSIEDYNDTYLKPIFDVKDDVGLEKGILLGIQSQEGTD